MKNKKISIINYGINNIKSIEMALLFLGYKPIITSDKKELANSDKIILPGVGSFGNGMNALSEIGIIDTIKKSYSDKIDILGICLGMQMLMEESEEFGNHKGLGLIEGSVKKIPNYKNSRKIPHVGWNTININLNNRSKSLVALNENYKNLGYYYFIHSFVAMPKNCNNILSYSNYEKYSFASSLIKENLYGVQFHPERSGKQGLELLNNFLIK